MAYANTHVNYHEKSCNGHSFIHGGMGDTSMENPETQDIDSDSLENYQEENIIQQLIYAKQND